MATAIEEKCKIFFSIFMHYSSLVPFIFVFSSFSLSLFASCKTIFAWGVV